MGLTGRGGFRTDTRTNRLQRLHGPKVARKPVPVLPSRGAGEAAGHQTQAPFINESRPSRCLSSSYEEARPGWGGQLRNASLKPTTGRIGINRERTAKVEKKLTAEFPALSRSTSASQNAHRGLWGNRTARSRTGRRVEPTLVEARPEPS
jgi:hypothetical protein